MRFINTIAVLAAFLAPFAHAIHDEKYLIQAVEKPKVSDTFWSSFWDQLSGKQKISTDLRVTVLHAETGAPVKNAQVLVGSKKGIPFANNFISTDESGVALFQDASLREGNTFPLTIAKSGFTTVSIMQSKSGEIEVRLQELASEQDFAFLQGKVTGFPTGISSDRLELGMFLPAFRPESMLNFDPRQFITSFKVKINLYGERDIPGNLVLPPQSKRYGLLPISVSKPEFIMPLATGTNAYMGALVGDANISQAVSAMQKKDFLEAINLARFSQVGWTTRRVDVKGSERFDVAVKHEVEQAAALATLNGIGEKLDAVAIAMIDPAGDQGDFFPLDVKATKWEQIKNGTTSIKLGLLRQRKSSDKFYVFTGIFDRNVMQATNSKWIVGSMQPLPNSKLSTQFKGYFQKIEARGVSNANREYRFTNPTNSSLKLSPDLTIVNIVSEKKNESIQGITRTLLWTAIIPGSSDRLSLPDLGRAVLPNPDSSKEERFTWEVIAIKTAGQGAKEAGLNI